MGSTPASESYVTSDVAKTPKSALVTGTRTRNQGFEETGGDGLRKKDKGIHCSI